MNLLENKVAVITGGTRGLGLGIAQTYAKEGAAVVVAGRSQSTIDEALKELRASGAQAEGFSCDVSHYEQVEALGKFAIETFGKIDIWVNNAGLSAPFGPTGSIPKETFRRVVDTNIIGVYNGSMIALKHMLPQRSGKLINIMGRSAANGVKFQNTYSASKVWVRSFTMALAQEYKESGVEIIAFNPGLVDTEMLRNVDAIEGYEKRLKPLETVMRFWAKPPEVPAQTALKLASSTTDGKSGLLVNTLSIPVMIGGLLREALRLILRKPAPDTSITIHTIRSSE